MDLERLREDLTLGVAVFLSEGICEGGVPFCSLKTVNILRSWKNKYFVPELQGIWEHAAVSTQVKDLISTY